MDHTITTRFSHVSNARLNQQFIPALALQPANGGGPGNLQNIPKAAADARQRILGRFKRKAKEIQLENQNHNWDWSFKVCCSSRSRARLQLGLRWVFSLFNPGTNRERAAAHTH